MKRFLSLILVFLLFAAHAEGVPPVAGNNPSVLIAEWRNDGSLEPVYAQNESLKRPMASTAKIMTYCVVADMVSDFEEKQIVITTTPLSTLTESASRAGFQKHVGEKFSCLSLLYGLMLPSGCDAAACLAYALTDGHIDVFVEKMNRKAAELGLNDTHFVDPTGLGAGNVSTAIDLVKLMRYAYNLPRFEEIVKSETYYLPGESAPMINTNLTVDEYNGGAHYSPYAVGGKTGFTNEAGRCLVSVWEKAGTRLVIAVLGGLTEGELSTAVRDSKLLGDWAFDEISENIRVSIDAPFAYVAPGETVSVGFRADEGVFIEWSTDRPEVVSVDAAGNVTGYSRGKARVTARTQTGNTAYTDVFCGLVPGVDLTDDCTVADFTAVSRDGMRFAVIQTMKGAEPALADIRAALDADLSVIPSVTAKAETAKAATAEAKALVKRLKADGVLSDIKYVSYDVYAARSAYGERKAKDNAAIILAFRKEAAKSGLTTLVFANSSVLKSADANRLKDAGVGVYLRYCPYETDFSEVPTASGAEPELWMYRSDGYFPSACDKNGKTRMCLAVSDNLGF